MEEVGLLLLPMAVHPVHAVPVLLDGDHRLPPDEELYATWRQPNAALWTLHPTARAREGPHADRAFPTWLWNTMLIAIVSTIISLICGMFAGYALARLRFRGSVPRHRDLHHLPGAADAALHPARGHHPRHAARQHALGADAHLPHDPDPFCTWLLMGYFKTIPKELEECARIDGATRFGAMVRIIFPVAIPGILSAGIFAFTLSWNEFIYALVFMASADQKTVRWAWCRADPRRFLLGPAHGGRAAGLGAGCAGVLLLRRVLRHRPHRIRERVKWRASRSAS